MSEFQNCSEQDDELSVEEAAAGGVAAEPLVINAINGCGCGDVNTVAGCGG